MKAEEITVDPVDAARAALGLGVLVYQSRYKCPGCGFGFHRVFRCSPALALLPAWCRGPGLCPYLAKIEPYEVTATFSEGPYG